MPKQRFPKLSIVGAGTVGSTLATAFHEQGFPVVSIINRTGKKALALAKAVKCQKAGTQFADLSSETEILLLAITESALESVIRQIALVKQLRFKKLLVIHCSAVYSSELLDPLRKKGALTASFHPIQSFPNGQPLSRLRSRLRGIYFGVDGEDAALRRVDELATILGAKVIVIPPELRPLYHVLCVFASGYLMMFMHTISEIAKRLSLTTPWTEVFGPLMTTAMENAVRSSAGTAMTGPIVRGDLHTVGLHLQALSDQAPQFLPLYTIGGIEIARIVRASGGVTAEEFDSILTLFKEFIKTQPKHTTKKVKR